MMTKERIRELIADRLDCSAIDVRGDDGAHFEATIVAASFEGKSRVARHQLIYAALGDHMREAIHALSFKTLTPTEFAQQPALQPTRTTAGTTDSGG